MSSPTETEVQNQIKNAVSIIDNIRLAVGETVFINWIVLEDTYMQSLEGDFVDEASAAVFRVRALLDQMRRSSASILDPQFKSYGRVRGIAETNVQDIIFRLYDDFVLTGVKVKSRAFSFGTPTASGTNVGTGILNRLNTDENGFTIEAQTPDAKKVRCLSDEHSGAIKHEEVFEILGAAPSRDFLRITGSGKRGALTAISARNSLTYVANPSFSEFEGAITAPTDITNWDVTTAIANFQLDQTNFYRGFDGDTTPTSVVFEDNDTLTQNFDVQRLQTDPNIPYYFQVAYNSEISGCNGTLTLTVGDQTASVNVSGVTGWSILRIALGTKNWYKNFKATTPVVSIALSGRTTGKLRVDDVIFSPMTNFDGSWYAMVGGVTPFLMDDYFQFTDTATDSKIQRYMWEAYNAYFPASGTGNWFDPAV